MVALKFKETQRVMELMPKEEKQLLMVNIAMQKVEKLFLVMLVMLKEEAL
jgi:hypothetical protein